MTFPKRFNLFRTIDIAQKLSNTKCNMLTLSHLLIGTYLPDYTA
jgi:hypothetical protein